MTQTAKPTMLVIVLAGCVAILSNFAVAQETIDTRIGTLEFTKDFEKGYPTHETVKKLYDEMDFQRATQAYMWSIPVPTVYSIRG